MLNELIHYIQLTPLFHAGRQSVVQCLYTVVRLVTHKRLDYTVGYQQYDKRKQHECRCGIKLYSSS